VNDRQPVSRRRAVQTLAGLGGAAGLAALAVSAGCTSTPTARTRTVTSSPGPTGTGSPPPTARPSTVTSPTGGGSPSPSQVTATGPGGSRSRSTVTAADWRALASGLAGSLLRPSAAGFGAASHVFNTRFDAVTPAAVVRCAHPADVVAAIAFAQRHGLHAVPRAGGHGYLGSSTVGAGLVIDTGPLDAVSYDAASSTATIGPGARLVDVYGGLAEAGRSIPAGSCPAVGMGGSALGGGLGVVSHAYGLTCDVVTAIDVVTADGRSRTVSATAEPDLFWALRGGGGGTIAIATSFRVQTFPTADCGLFFASWPWSAAARVVAGWQRWIATMPDSSWGNLHLNASGSNRSVSVSGVSLTGSAGGTAAALVAAVGVEPSSLSSQTSSFLHTMLVEAGCSADGLAECHLAPAGNLARQGFLAGSTVAGAALGASGITRLLGAVAAGGSAGLPVSAICDPLGGAVGRVSAAATAFPWRAAAFSVQWYSGLPTPAPAATVARAQSWVASSRHALAPWAVGAYVNYPDASVVHPQAFHGATTSRLTSILRRYDPDGFFTGPGRLPV
jgi:FAD/FMN-containing dehydrogenase